jgi:hypothetical protein
MIGRGCGSASAVTFEPFEPACHVANGAFQAIQNIANPPRCRIEAANVGAQVATSLTGSTACFAATAQLAGRQAAE